MRYKVNVIEGAGAGLADELVSAGVKTTDPLLEASSVDTVREL